MQDNLLQTFREMQEKLKDILQVRGCRLKLNSNDSPARPQNNTSLFSLSLDVWTATNQAPFMGVNIHFIDNNWVPHRILLDFIEVVGKHTGENLATHLVDTLAFYRIVDRVSGCILSIAAY